MNMLVEREITELARVADRSASLDQSLARLSEELAHGVLVVQHDRTLLHANQAARDELERNAVLGLAGDSIRPRSLDGRRCLDQALGRAVQGSRSLITLQGNAQAVLTLAVVPLETTSDQQQGKVALLFSRASICASLMVSFFARSHQLTSAEEVVLGQLCRGHSTPEIASLLSVAVSTVRTHVRSLCSKTRAAGVRELLNRIAVLPPVAPSVLYEHIH